MFIAKYGAFLFTEIGAFVIIDYVLQLLRNKCSGKILFIKKDLEK